MTSKRPAAFLSATNGCRCRSNRKSLTTGWAKKLYALKLMI
nr:MAG TPA: hypothetical protein [Caudoviricetes sp.]